MSETKLAIDVCCGGKMFYFDRNNQDVLFCDVRKESHILCDGRLFEISPDVVADFRNLPFADESFYLVVFDPPHLYRLGQKSWMNKKYGKLDKNAWRDDLAKGFNECMRILKVNGTLIFKWSETQIKLCDILSCFPIAPLLGQKTTAQTHWLVFLKTGGQK